MERIKPDSSVALLSSPVVSKEPKQASPFVEALEVLANQDVVAASKKLLSCAQNLSQTSSELWQGYLVAVASAISIKMEAPELALMVDLGHLGERLLKDDTCSFQTSAKSRPPEFLYRHILILLDSGNPVLAKALLEALVRKKLFKGKHDSNRLSNLWVRATTESMDSLHSGLEAYRQSLELGISWIGISPELFDEYCGRLVELSKQAQLDAKTARLMLNFLSQRNLAISQRDTLETAIRNYLRDQNDQEVDKRFEAPFKQMHWQTQTPSVENLQTHIQNKRWLPAISLLTQLLALNPSPIAPEDARTYIHQMITAARMSEKAHIKQMANSLLKDTHVRKYVAEVGLWLVDQARNREAQEWFDLVISLKLELPDASRQAFARLACDLTWKSLQDKDSENCFRNAIDNGLVSYSDIVEADPELLIELAEALLGGGKYMRTCEWLYSDNFAGHINTRNSLFIKAVTLLIQEEEYDQAQKALTTWDGPEDLLDPVWEDLVSKVATYSPGNLVKVLSCAPPNAPPEEFVKSLLIKALNTNDLKTCFMLVKRFPCAYQLLCKREFSLQDKNSQANAWIVLIEYLAEKRSSILLEMIKQAPHEVAEGFFSSFDTLPKKQSQFFRRLIIGAAKIIPDDDDASFFALIRFRKSLEPLFINFELMHQRFYCDTILGYHLTRSNCPDIFTTGILAASDVTSKQMLLLSSLEEITDNWDRIMGNRLKDENTPIFIPEQPSKERLAEIIPHCTNCLGSTDTYQMVLQIIHRTSQIGSILVKEEHQDILGDVWNWIEPYEIPKSQLMMFATDIAKTGARNHLPYVREAIDFLLKKCSSVELMSDDEKEALYPALRLLVKHDRLDSDGTLAEILRGTLVKDVLTESQLAKLWNTYFTNVLMTDQEISSIVDQLQALSSHIPAILRHRSPPTKEKPFPFSVDAALSKVACLVHLDPNLKSLEKQAKEIFFSALPEPYYKGRQAYKRVVDVNNGYDYSLYLRYIEKIIQFANVPSDEKTYARDSAWVCLWELLKVIPAKKEADRKNVGDLVSKYIVSTCSLDSNPTNDGITPTPIGLWQLAFGNVLNHLPYKGYELHLLATGKMPKRHVYTGSALVALYATAIQQAAAVGSQESLEMAHHLAQEADQLKKSKDHYALLVPCIKPLIAANQHRSLNLREGGRFLDILFTLGNKWLVGQPYDVRIDNYVALLASTRKGVSMTEINILPNTKMFTHSTSAWVIPAAGNFEEAMESGLASGFYDSNPALFYTHLSESLDFFAKLFKQGCERTYVINLLNLAKTRFPVIPEHRQTMGEWVSLIR